MARALEDIQTDIDRLQTEYAEAAAAKWLSLIPPDAGARLVQLAREAAMNVGGNYDQGTAEWEIAPGVTLIVTYDTNVSDESED